MSRIRKLTPEQEEAIPEWLDRYWKIGTCTDPTDKKTVASVLADMYRLISEKPPLPIWCDSPLTSCLAISILKAGSPEKPLGDSLRDSLWSPLGDSLWSSLRDPLWNSLRDSLWSSLRDSLWSSLWNPLWNPLWSSLGGSLRDSLRKSFGKSLGYPLGRSLRHSLGHSLRHSLWMSLRHSLWMSLANSFEESFGDPLRHLLGGSLGYSSEHSLGTLFERSLGLSLWSSFGHSVWDSLRNSLGDLSGELPQRAFWGSTNAFWLCLYSFCRWIGVQYTEESCAKLDLQERLARSSFWIWPYTNYCIVSARPSELHWTRPFGVLHRDGGPAIAFRDGWKFWLLNGVHVPQWLAEQRDIEIDPKRIAECDNAEVRREFVRKVGLDRIYHKLGGKVIHERTVYLKTPYNEHWPCHYKLVDLAYAEGVLRRVLEMPNPSLPGVKHVEYVPNECETVEQAMNFRLNRTENQVDDEAGVEWYLHGDVIVTPKRATSFKRWPERIA